MGEGKKLIWVAKTTKELLFCLVPFFHLAVLKIHNEAHEMETSKPQVVIVVYLSWHHLSSFIRITQNNSIWLESIEKTFLALKLIQYWKPLLDVLNHYVPEEKMLIAPIFHCNNLEDPIIDQPSIF